MRDYQRAKQLLKREQLSNFDLDTFKKDLAEFLGGYFSVSDYIFEEKAVKNCCEVKISFTIVDMKNYYLTK